MAIDTRTPPSGAVIHSDRGVRLGSWAFTDRAKASGLLPSMGSIADCFDDAMIESFWSRMQVEPLDRRRRNTRIELANAMFEYLLRQSRGGSRTSWASLSPCDPAANTSVCASLGSWSTDQTHHVLSWWTCCSG
jgi:transposase InsO family protein